MGKLERQKEDMIAHVPNVVGDEEEDSPFVFSPRMADDSSVVLRPRIKLLRNLRSMFCCLSPDVKPLQQGTSSISSVTVYPSDEGPEFIIGEPSSKDSSKKTLVLDLDETLVHSTFSQVLDPDYIIPVEIDGILVDVYVRKRPGLESFLQYACQRFEVVIFTASLSKYADPLLDKLDPERKVRWRLFREACSTYRGTYVKDLCRLGRDLSQTIIVDNSPLSYVFQPENAIPIEGFVGDPSDRALNELIPLLDALVDVTDVRVGLQQFLDRSQNAFEESDEPPQIVEIEPIQLT